MLDYEINQACETRLVCEPTPTRKNKDALAVVGRRLRGCWHDCARTSASVAYGVGRAYQHNYNDGAFDPNGRPSGPVWLESEMRVIRVAGTVSTVRLAAAFAFCVDVAAALRGDASAAPASARISEPLPRSTAGA